MTNTAYQTVLFLCTGNYYRSRFAEVLFNTEATRLRLGWRAGSRGLAIERGIYNVGPMAESAVALLGELGIACPSFERYPLAVSDEDFALAQRIIALDEREHRPLMSERYPHWTDRVEYWDIEDVPGILPRIDRAVRQMALRLQDKG